MYRIVVVGGSVQRGVGLDGLSLSLGVCTTVVTASVLTSGDHVVLTVTLNNVACCPSLAVRATD